MTAPNAARAMQEYQAAIRAQEAKYQAIHTQELLVQSRDTINDMQATIDSHRIIIAGLNAALTESMMHLKATNEAEHEAAARVDTLTNALADMTERRDNLAAAYTMLNDDNRANLQTARELRDELDSTQRAALDQFNAANEAANDLQSRYDRLFNEHAARTAELHRVTLERDNARNVLDSANGRLIDTLHAASYWANEAAANVNTAPRTARAARDDSERYLNERAALIDNRTRQRIASLQSTLAPQA